MPTESSHHSSRTRQQTALILGWSGVVPFAAMALVAWTGAPEWLLHLLVGYGVLILAFMGGTLWAAALERPSEPEAPLVASIILVLAALPALLLPLVSAALLLAVLFGLHALAESLWARESQAAWYKGMRLGISATVIALLVLTFLIEVGA
ncbi:DUF3429 domain-containing protein [Wenzhouxiangella sp. XN201]|uniref:DUF3429 domain-containing protein n=1 Tax=Wenzhouxiangella sp. XN201 TaxID=2710755 RepID=UPI0013C6DDE3|nr:DUF3429 domain-containing protein [Wenzhouxiangella sp. XN201]NEZ02532.1 DUF3429 domain-containing protein [Wenzhouxiangella sp. XN201]